MSLFSFLDSFFTDLGKKNKDPYVKEKEAFHWFTNKGYYGEQRSIDSYSSIELELLLVRATTENNELVIKYLLRNGVNPLKAILQTETEAQLSLLKQNGASLKHELIDPSTVEGDKVQYIKKLIRFGANPNACVIVNEGYDSDAATAEPVKFLPLAYSLDSIEAVKCLLEHGANPLETDNTGRRALDYALLAASSEICDLMLAYAKKSGQPIDISSSLLRLMKAKKSVRSSNIKELLAKTNYLIKLGADVNYQDKQGVSVMMAAMSRKGIAAVQQLLVEHGANLELKDAKGRTALVRVLNKKDTAGFATLEKLGAKISSKARQYYEALVEQERDSGSDEYDETTMTTSEIRGRNGHQLAYFKSIHKE